MMCKFLLDLLRGEYTLAGRLKEAPHGFTDWREQIEAISDMPRLELGRRQFGDLKMVVVHHSGAKPSSIMDLARWAIYTRGQPTIPYHMIVTGDGMLHFTARLAWATQHTFLHHGDSVGVTFMGNFVDEPPTQEALETMRFLIRALWEFFGQDWGEYRPLALVPHNLVWNGETWFTQCPGKAWDALIWGGDWPRF